MSTRPRTMGLWKRGPPPSIGWWPASYFRSMRDIRWWDGSGWSKPATAADNAERAAWFASTRAVYSFDVEWTERPAWWPERSKT